MQDNGRQFGLALLAASVADAGRAAGLAQRLGLPLLPAGSNPALCSQANAVLVVSGRALSLQQTGKGAPGAVAVNFGSAGMRHRRRYGANELLGKAVGLGKKKGMRILDATAGLGTDGFILADLGCEVLLCERDPVVVELLRSGLLMACDSGDPWLISVAHRMSLCPGDVRQMPAARLKDVDVIYLDPMFPQRAKTAAVKKEMALFQMLLEGSTEPQDTDTLLLWARGQDAARVVVKRPLRAPELLGLQPSHCITGKSVRYDVYIHRGLS